MNDITEHDDINVADSMPPADPALLASANRMLLDRIEEAKTTICNAAETLEPYVGGEIDPTDMDLNEIAESVALNVVDLMAKLSNAQSLAEVLKRNFESKERECEALRKRAEAANERAAERPIAGYTTGDLDEIHLTIEGARESAEFATIQSGLEMNVYELRFVGTAKRAAEWVPA